MTNTSAGAGRNGLSSVGSHRRRRARAAVHAGYLDEPGVSSVRRGVAAVPGIDRLLARAMGDGARDVDLRLQAAEAEPSVQAGTVRLIDGLAAVRPRDVVATFGPGTYDPSPGQSCCPRSSLKKDLYAVRVRERGG